jgi:predicted  nucleic acid-binding Zn-ribbon protein
VTHEFNRHKQVAQMLLEEAQKAGELTDEMREKFAELPETFEELEEMLVSERAKAELNIDTDPRIVDQYRTRKQAVRAHLPPCLQHLH